MVFARDLNLCIERVQNRKGHQTLPPGEQSIEFVRRTARQLVLPTRDEGIDFCRFVRHDKDMERVAEEILKDPEPDSD